MSKRITIAHYIGEPAYLRTDTEQLPRLVTRITISHAGTEYQLRHADRDGTWHQACEIMREPAKRKVGY